MKKETQNNTILLVTVFGNFITPFMLSAVNIALPTIGSHFQVDSVSLNWVATAYLLAVSVILLPFGKVADIYGRKKMYFIGMLLSGLTTFLCSIAPTFAVFIAARVAQGLSIGMTLGIGPAILTSAFPPEKRGKVLGIATAAVYIGASAGPLLGGVLVENFGWRGVFWTVVPLFALVSVMTITLIKSEWASETKVSFDFIGAALYAVGIVLLIYGVSEIPAAAATGFAIGGLAILVVFILFEMKVDSALLDIKLFRGNRVFVFSNIATLINYCAISCMTYLLSLKLQYFQGLSPFDAGLVLFIQPLLQAIFSPVAGRVSDRIHPKKVASFGMAVSCVGIVLLIVESIYVGMWLIILALVMLGLGFALFASPNTNAIMSVVDRSQFGVASSMIATMRTIGQVFSMGIVMSVFALMIGKVQMSQVVYEKFSGSLQAIYIIMVIISVAGIFASLVKNKRVRGQEL